MNGSRGTIPRPIIPDDAQGQNMGFAHVQPAGLRITSGSCCLPMVRAARAGFANRSVSIQPTAYVVVLCVDRALSDETSCSMPIMECRLSLWKLNFLLPPSCRIVAWFDSRIEGFLEEHFRLDPSNMTNVRTFSGMRSAVDLGSISCGRIWTISSISQPMKVGCFWQ